MPKVMAKDCIAVDDLSYDRDVFACAVVGFFKTLRYGLILLVPKRRTQPVSKLPLECRKRLTTTLSGLLG